VLTGTLSTSTANSMMEVNAEDDVIANIDNNNPAHATDAITSRETKH
jgi:hypothetical protein